MQLTLLLWVSLSSAAFSEALSTSVFLLFTLSLAAGLTRFETLSGRGPRVRFELVILQLMWDRYTQFEITVLVLGGLGNGCRQAYGYDV